jgi:predicted NAD/FAD-binding protein
MTFGVSRDRGLFEWAGTSLGAVFAQKSNIFKRRVWLMLFDIIRFNQFALDLLSLEDESEEDDSGANGMDAKFRKPHHQQTIGEYLDREGYSEAFRNDYLIPMTAAVWSTSPDKCSLNFPAITLVRFMWNHHLLTTISARPTWMTLKGGSQQYVDAILKDFPKEKIHLKTGVASLNSRDDGRVELELSDGSKQVFDHVVLATHGDQATEIIRSSATPEELKIMSNFATSENIAVLHSDLDASSPCRKAFAC